MGAVLFWGTLSTGLQASRSQAALSAMPGSSVLRQKCCGPDLGHRLAKAAAKPHRRWLQATHAYFSPYVEDALDTALTYFANLQSD